MSLGILAAVNQNGPVDYLSVTVAILFYSMPNFVMGFLLILLFAIWLPDHGIDLGFNVGGWDRPQDWILPDDRARRRRRWRPWPATPGRA